MYYPYAKINMRIITRLGIGDGFKLHIMRFSFRKNGYTSDKKYLSPKAYSFDKH